MSVAPRWTVSSVREALVARKISARELADDFFTRIERENPALNAYLILSKDRAYSQAANIDTLVSKGASLPRLAGVPVAIKDVLNTRGTRTTCGSRILETYISPYDATAVERLDQAGAIFLGKTNCDEFAMGSSNENSAYGPVQNPA
ncbi:MAG: amidase, partial [Candidatus Acidiferrales bacterium]